MHLEFTGISSPALGLLPYSVLHLPAVGDKVVEHCNLIRLPYFYPLTPRQSGRLFVQVCNCESNREKKVIGSKSSFLDSSTVGYGQRERVVYRTVRSHLLQNSLFLTGKLIFFFCFQYRLRNKVKNHSLVVASYDIVRNDGDFFR